MAVALRARFLRLKHGPEGRLMAEEALRRPAHDPDSRPWNRDWEQCAQGSRPPPRAEPRPPLPHSRRRQVAVSGEACDQVSILLKPTFQPIFHKQRFEGSHRQGHNVSPGPGQKSPFLMLFHADEATPALAKPKAWALDFRCILSFRLKARTVGLFILAESRLHLRIRPLLRHKPISDSAVRVLKMIHSGSGCGCIWRAAFHSSIFFGDRGHF